MILRFLPGRILSLYEITLIPEVTVQLFIARLKVSFLSSEKYLKIEHLTNFSRQDTDNIVKAKMIAGIVEGLSQRTPWKSTCLVKALAVRQMLQKRGISQVLHIGVAKMPGETLQTHAWLSVNGEVILGGINLDNFSEFK
jgi:hypothetical protein